MADNVLLNVGVGGDTLRSVDKGGIETPASLIDIGGAGAEVLLTAGQAVMAASVPVVIASNQTAVPVSSATLATAAKQPALGTAGTASADVITIQGIASGTPQNVSANAAVIPAATAMQNAATANGNGTNLPVTGMAVALLNIVSSVAMSGGTTINFEASVDDTTFVTIAAHQIGSNGSLVTTTTADGDFRIATAGYKSVRARISAYSAGTITIKGYTDPTASQPTAVALGTGSNTIGALTANQSVNVAQIGGTTVVNGGTAGIQSVGGGAATNVAVNTNPLNQGAQAVSSENAAVTTGRMVQLVADLAGKLIVLPYANPENFVSGVTAAMTATTSTSLLAAPASGLRNYITQITITNSHATVGTFVNIQDGSGGTTIYSGYAAAAGGGFTITFPTPLRQPTTATAVFVVNATTGSNTVACACGYKGI